jgi:hypothetical protein
MRGRLFNLFRLFCVVVSGSLSFSFTDLLPSPFSSDDVTLLRLLVSGEVRAFWPGKTRAAGRLRFSRDVGRGTIDDVFSTGFSSFSSAAAAFSSGKSFDSVVDDVAAGDPLRPRLRRLNCGRGFNRRETVVLSASADFSVVDVVA